MQALQSQRLRLLRPQRFPITAALEAMQACLLPEALYAAVDKACCLRLCMPLLTCMHVKSRWVLCSKMSCTPIIKSMTVPCL